MNKYIAVTKERVFIIDGYSADDACERWNIHDAIKVVPFFNTEEPKVYDQEAERKVRVVMLPSGRTIEVVSFTDAPPPTENRSYSEPETSLHICPSCDSNLVYATDWEMAGEIHWRISLRCPNCEWVGDGTYNQNTVESFDFEMDTGTETMVRDLKRFTRQNMEEWFDRFVSALWDDHIVPEDF